MSTTVSGRPIRRADARAFSAVKNGVEKAIPRTSIPCSSITLKASMLSSPPEKRAMALVFNIDP